MQRQIQCVGDLGIVQERDIALAPLDHADIGPVQSRLFSQVIL